MIIFTGQTRRYGIYILCCLTLLLTVSCNGAESTEASFPQIPPTPASGQPVEYGASLSEWEEATQAEASTSVNTKLDTASYQEIRWDALIPAGFTPDAIMSKYEDQLAQFEDGSEEAYDLYSQMQEEFNSAPVNKSMDGELIKLPGFIAPLEYTDGSITKFLLVPYFGACIHVPPPPANQTVLVTLSDGEGIGFLEAYSPFWVMGELTAEGASTDLAQAGYYIEDAFFELYSDES
ncbi:MAG: DUF3299 domain-containing protein [Chloroflexota bacterium]